MKNNYVALAVSREVKLLKLRSFFVYGVDVVQIFLCKYRTEMKGTLDINSLEWCSVFVQMFTSSFA